MRRISWERLAALDGAAFVVLYVVAFVGLVRARARQQHARLPGSRRRLRPERADPRRKRDLAWRRVCVDGQGLHLDPNTRRYFEDIGFLLFTSAALAGIVLAVGVSLAALRYALLPRSLCWAGFVVALLLPTAIAFIGFLIFLVWVLAVSVALALRRPAAV